MQFGVFQDVRLNKQDGLFRIDTSRQPVDDHLEGRRSDAAWIVVLRGQRVPVGNEEEAGILVLQAHPVFKYAMIVAKVQAAGRPHAGKNSFCVHDGFI